MIIQGNSTAGSISKFLLVPEFPIIAPTKPIPNQVFTGAEVGLLGAHCAATISVDSCKIFRSILLLSLLILDSYTPSSSWMSLSIVSRPSVDSHSGKDFALFRTSPKIFFFITYLVDPGERIIPFIECARGFLNGIQFPSRLESIPCSRSNYSSSWHPYSAQAVLDLLKL